MGVMYGIDAEEVVCPVAEAVKAHGFGIRKPPDEG